MKILDWNDIVNLKPKEYLSKDEIKVYTKASKDFDKMVKATKPKKIKKFVEIALSLSSMRFARQYADAHKQPNLYKAIYKLVTNYPYKY